MYRFKFTKAVSTIPGWAVVAADAGGWDMTIISPFELGYGVQLLLHIYSEDGLSFKLTDSGRAACYVTHRDLVLTEELIHELNNTHGIKYAQVDNSGEIIAKHRDLNLLHKAVEDAAKLALAMVFKCPVSIIERNKNETR
ncbi:hypothetical protein [Snodgrassella communis]|jgi:hypothetical protein|uniref:hypothetical protein n=1 Tax=Snodgrassella communis TaxID=2946699 RepID=UPI000C1E9593|nr:hypothetical protein [Snodgrassella communis]PIT23602.1 hypothetical protein BGI35_01620 [Snodgrassella communis]